MDLFGILATPFALTVYYIHTTNELCIFRNLCRVIYLLFLLSGLYWNGHKLVCTPLNTVVPLVDTDLRYYVIRDVFDI